MLQHLMFQSFCEARGLQRCGLQRRPAIDLQAVPAVNGVIDGTDLVYRDYYDISIAVATPKGLVVPVLRNVEDLDFAGVERVGSTLMCIHAALLICGASCFILSSV